VARASAYRNNTLGFSDSAIPVAQGAPAAVLLFVRCDRMAGELEACRICTFTFARVRNRSMWHITRDLP